LLASSSDLRQWAHRGQEFFSNGLYALATSCFERAGRDKEAEIADAYYDMSEAKQLPHDEEATNSAFLNAALKMVNCAKRGDSSHSAANLWYHAATCFAAAREIPLASESYRQGAFYDRAALVSFDAEDIDDCLLTLESHYDEMSQSVAEKVMPVSRLHYLRERNYRYASGSIV
jgi:hypothetical protein